MFTTLRAGRALAIAAAAALTVMVAAAPVSAHAGIASSSPANGAQLTAAPKSVTLTFEEKVRVDAAGTRIVDAGGATVPGKVAAKGTTVTITPAKPLASGRYAATWQVSSGDGHTVYGAIAFTVDQPNPKGAPAKVTTMPRVPTMISAALPGSRTLTMTSKARSGDIEWTHADLPEPMLWEFAGNGTKGTATGVLPMPGEWLFEATLDMPGGAVVVVSGSVTLKG